MTQTMTKACYTAEDQALGDTLDVLRSMKLGSPLPQGVDAVFLDEDGTIHARMKPNRDHKRCWTVTLKP